MDQIQRPVFHKLLLVIAVLAASACSNSSSKAGIHAAVRGSTTSTASPFANAPQSSRTTGQDAGSTSSTLKRGPSGGPQAHSPTTRSLDENNPVAGPPLNPCHLVTKSEAEAIIGRPIDDPHEAPLGPTCIYKTSDSKIFVTVAIQLINFDQFKPHITNLAPVSGLSRQAYCGEYGQPTLLAPLTQNSILTVSAPCLIAQHFAAKALPRL